MKRRFEFKKMLSLLLAAVLIFGGCGKIEEEKSTETEETVESGFVKEENPPESHVPETQAPPVTEEENPYGDLLLEMEDHGKVIVPAGDLCREEYTADLVALEEVLRDFGHNVSLVIESLDGKKALSYNTEKTLFCACTVKAPYVLYCLEEMEKNDISLDFTLTYESEHYESGTGDMQYSPVGTVFTLETIIDKTLGISDNVGYRMLVDYFGREGYNAWISEMGCPSLQISPTVWSLKAKAKELAFFWREMEAYFKSDGKYADFLYSVCTGTASAYATQSLGEVHTSHKSGHNGTGKYLAYSDAGILWQENGGYIYSILTDAPGLYSSAGANLMKAAMEIIHNKLMN